MHKSSKPSTWYFSINAPFKVDGQTRTFTAILQLVTVWYFTMWVGYPTKNLRSNKLLKPKTWTVIIDLEQDLITRSPPPKQVLYIVLLSSNIVENHCNLLSRRNLAWQYKDMVWAGNVGGVHPGVVGRPQQALPENVEEESSLTQFEDADKDKDKIRNDNQWEE